MLFATVWVGGTHHGGLVVACDATVPPARLVLDDTSNGVVEEKRKPWEDEDSLVLNQYFPGPVALCVFLLMIHLFPILSLPEAVAKPNGYRPSALNRSIAENARAAEHSSSTFQCQCRF